MRIQLMLVLALLITACASGEKKNIAEKQAELHYEHGTSELLAKNYTQAITHLLKAA